ncbi:SUSD5 protein, partial [Campylorhamphus procurvoides]|nr:SUSD5 protein [Campylorhamphus procurvoides]
GKVFALESKNNSQGLDLAEAEKACVDLSARLATAEELKRAVLDCSFVGCTTGWLASGSAGTIICRKTGSKQQSVKAIDVKIETDPFVNDQYDAFCVKDEDKPCGDPPSFPHTVLHGHTGFEMGDELLYVCAQGYVMGNKEKAFTLLCDSCGEWYGQVQACVKDETEAHIDYEDNFPDDRSIPIVENKPGNGKEIEQEQEQLSFSKISEEGRTGSTKGVTQDTDTSEKRSKAPTESPVSLLSQKNLFWFLSETISEPESKKETDDSTKAQFSEGDNHIGVKKGYDEPGAKMFYDSEDFPIGPILTTNDTKTAIDAAAITDGSWLDGYPVTQEVVEDDEEEGDKVDSSMGTEDDIVLTTDQPNHVEVRKLGNGSPAPEEGLTQIVAATTRIDDEGAKETSVPLTSVSGLENFSVGRGYDDATKEHPAASLETVTQEPSTILFDITSLKMSMSETSVMVSPYGHTPYAEPRETTTYPEQVATTAPAPDIITDTTSQELAEEENLTQGLGEKPIPTSEPCDGEDCPKSSKGAIIAVIVILLCLLLVAAVLAVWFFKKRQQKNSVYKLNGRCQPRHHCYHHYHHQHIEMQKV